MLVSFGYFKRGAGIPWDPGTQAQGLRKILDKRERIKAYHPSINSRNIAF